MEPIGRHCGEVMYFGSFSFWGELGFLNWGDVCMCVVNKQFELLEFVFDSVYVDLQYDKKQRMSITTRDTPKRRRKETQP